MWQWFLDSGIYMIIALLVGAALIYIEIRLSKMAVRLIAPGNKTDDFEKVRRILANTIATILGLIIAFIAISYIVSRCGIDTVSYTHLRAHET